jgi:hypothetical protein
MSPPEVATGNKVRNHSSTKCLTSTIWADAETVSQFVSVLDGTYYFCLRWQAQVYEHSVPRVIHRKKKHEFPGEYED